MSNRLNITAERSSTSIYILVFKTNVDTKNDISMVAPFLNHLTGIIKWNVDLHDIDKVLRVETITDDAFQIIHALELAGYECEELPD